MPENLKGAAAHIWTAWHSSDNAKAFRASLDEHGISLAAVTKEEADQSHRKAAFAKEVGNFAPDYREGEIVAVTETGRVYKLNQRMTGEEQTRIDKFLKPLDRSQLQGIEATKETLKARVEQRNLEVQAFRDLLRDMNNAERVKRAGETKGKAPKMGGRDKLKPIKVASSIGVAAVNGAFKTAEKIADGVLGIFDPVLSPAQKADGEIASREREADACQTIDFAKYTSENTQRSMEEQERQQARENGRGEQGRER